MATRIGPLNPWLTCSSLRALRDSHNEARARERLGREKAVARGSGVVSLENEIPALRSANRHSQGVALGSRTRSVTNAKDIEWRV